jgi:hypothetical protein
VNALKTRNLLNLRNAKDAKSVQNAEVGYAAVTQRPWLRGLDLNQRPSGYEN